MNDDDAIINLRVPRKIYKAIAKRADEERRSIQSLVRLLLERAVQDWKVNTSR